MNCINSRTETKYKMASNVCLDNLGNEALEAFMLIGFDRSDLLKDSFVDDEGGFTLGDIHNVISNAQRLDKENKHTDLINDFYAKYYTAELYYHDHLFDKNEFIERSTRDFAHKDVVVWSGSVYYIYEHEGELLAFESGDFSQGVRNFKNNIFNEIAYFIGKSDFYKDL